jgi:hypothetical protein
MVILPRQREGDGAALGTAALNLKQAGWMVRVDPSKENGRAPTHSLDPRVITSLQVGDWLEMLTTLRGICASCSCPCCPASHGPWPSE